MPMIVASNGGPHVLGRQHLHIGLPPHDLLAGLARVFAAALADGGLIDGRDGQFGRFGVCSKYDGLTESVTLPEAGCQCDVRQPSMARR